MSDLINRLTIKLPAYKFCPGCTVRNKSTNDIWIVGDVYYDVTNGYRYVSEDGNYSAFESELETVSNVS